jgi:hypothetical protein
MFAFYLKSIVSRGTRDEDLDPKTLKKLLSFLEMYKRDSASEDKFYMKDIVGYDGEFNSKVKVWMIKFLSSITTKDQQKDYYAFRPDRVDFK